MNNINELNILLKTFVGADIRTFVEKSVKASELTDEQLVKGIAKAFIEEDTANKMILIAEKVKREQK